MSDQNKSNLPALTKQVGDLATVQAYIAERVLRDFRSHLYDRIQELPAARLADTPPAQLVSVVLAEAGELTEFFGQAFSIPLVSGFTLIAGP